MSGSSSENKQTGPRGSVRQGLKDRGSHLSQGGSNIPWVQDLNNKRLSFLSISLSVGKMEPRCDLSGTFVYIKQTAHLETVWFSGCDLRGFLAGALAWRWIKASGVSPIWGQDQSHRLGQLWTCRWWQSGPSVSGLGTPRPGNKATSMRQSEPQGQGDQSWAAHIPGAMWGRDRGDRSYLSMWWFFMRITNNCQSVGRENFPQCPEEKRQGKQSWSKPESLCHSCFLCHTPKGIL